MVKYLIAFLVGNVSFDIKFLTKHLKHRIVCFLWLRYKTLFKKKSLKKWKNPDYNERANQWNISYIFCFPSVILSSYIP